ncbi:FecR family protein [Caulobacter endophyticus]|uniref:FecR family protein n=1 Tax=Caulobacter endophyticus TaxID=2172652 RepID=UPI00240F058D|nr:FecR domain-containing protein [Caulobacter endophyticus]MDG2527209.1 FecR domain-containing protein [Caulobacter endophyticus]
MSTRSVNDRDDREAALWADARRDAAWSPKMQARLEQWLEGRPDREDLLARHEALIDDAAVIWATQRMANARAKARRLPAAPRAVIAGAAFAGVVGVLVALGGGLATRGDLIEGTRGVTPRPIALADGSSVRLNGQSQVRVQLGEHERRLHLKGEGFFEVAPDKSRPFSVEVDGVRVTAVGTRFNVDQRDGADGAVVEVQVFEGIVRVTGQGAPVNLHAGERATVAKGLVRRAALARPELETDVPSWAKGWLEFDEATLGSVVEDLERATGVEVKLADPAIGRVLVSGRFAYDDPENALAAMARLHGFKLTRQGADQFEISGG